MRAFAHAGATILTADESGGESAIRRASFDAKSGRVDQGDRMTTPRQTVFGAPKQMLTNFVGDLVP